MLTGFRYCFPAADGRACRPDFGGVQCNAACVPELVFPACAALALALATAPAGAVLPFHFGLFAPARWTESPMSPASGLAHVTKIEGSDIRTGATAVLPNADPWDHKVSAAFFAFNGNGEMTGTHWIEESGYLEEPVVLTDTLDVGRAADGVVSWVIEHHPAVGRGDDVPLPVVAECDDALLNDIQARAVSAADVVRLLDSAAPGQFARGSVGAGTGMNAFGFRAGIGSASRVLPAATRRIPRRRAGQRQYRQQPAPLTIVGVPVGQRLAGRIAAGLSKAHGRCAAALAAAASSSSSRPMRRWTAGSCARWRCALRWEWRAPA